ncbi:MAG: acyl carrier protein, partial [Treponema sp.]|nr:acyl carrier protein [Treponema sp.]
TADSSQETVDTWDSMHQLAIAFEIENDFGISLDPEEIIQFKSVKEIVAFLESKK